MLYESITNRFHLKVCFLMLLLPLLSLIETRANPPDSLDQLINAAIGHERFQLLYDWSWKIRKKDNKRAEKLALQSIRLAETQNDSFYINKCYANLAVIIQYQNRFKESINYLNNSLEYFKENHKKDEVTKMLFYLGAIHSASGQYTISDSLLYEAEQNAFLLEDTLFVIQIGIFQSTNYLHKEDYKNAETGYLKTLALAKDIKDTANIPIILFNLGIVKRKERKYAESLAHYFQALDGTANDELLEARILNSIGNVYNNLKDWDKALLYHQKSLAIKKRLNIDASIAHSLNNIGVIYKKMMNYGDALSCYHEALKIRQTLGGKANYVEQTLNNIGSIHLMLSNIDSAFYYYQKSLELAIDNQQIESQCRAYHSLALVYFESKRLNKAIESALKSLTIADERKDLHFQQINHKLLSTIYEQQKKYKQSLFHKEQSTNLEDSIYNLETFRTVSKLEKEYDTQQLNKELSSKNSKLIATKDKLGRVVFRHRLLIFSFIILLIFSAYILLTRKQKRTIVATREVVEENTSNIIHQKYEIFFEQLMAKINEQQMVSGVPSPKKVKISKVSDFITNNVNTEADWEDFIFYFTKVHKDFFKNLKETYPSITVNELNLCALIKLNMLNNEIAQVLGISPDSVRKAQHRLSKKMDLPNTDALRTYILTT